MTFGMSQFEVSASFVDTPSETAPVTTQDEPGEGLELGWPVKISRGKHGGKTGTVTYIEPKHVWVMEDVTHIEVRLKILLRGIGRLPD